MPVNADTIQRYFGLKATSLTCLMRYRANCYPDWKFYLVWAGYGVFFLFFGTLAFWTRLTEEHPKR